MRISGIQKLTLLDYPGHIAATLFTPGCDLRCPFCHNSELVNDCAEAEYDPDEVLDFLRTRVGKLSGVAITGGEPLMQPGIEEYIQKIRELGFKVKLDTNGTYPEKLRSLIEKKLVDYVAMDIKNRPGSWLKTAGFGSPEDGNFGGAEKLFEKTKISMDILKTSGIEFEFRTTVVKELHSREDIEELAKFVGDVPHYYLQSFIDSGKVLGTNAGADTVIDYGDSESEKAGGSSEKENLSEEAELNYSGFHAWDKKTMSEFLEIVREKCPNAELRGVE